MTRTEFIEQKMHDVRVTIVTSQRLSFLLFIVAVISIALSMIPELSMPKEFLKFGLSSMTTVSGVALQGLKYLRRNKLTELKYCLDKVECYEELEDFDRKIVDRALDK